MRQELTLRTKLEQRLRMAPQIIQSMEILQLPSLELQEKLAEELLENPVLEMKEAKGKETSQDGSQEKEAPPEGEGAEAMFDKLLNTASDLSPRMGSVRSVHAGKDRKLEAMQNTADRPASLPEYLVRQMSELGIDEHRRELAEYLINNIDESGYLRYPVEELARSWSQQADEPDDKDGEEEDVSSTLLVRPGVLPGEVVETPEPEVLAPVDPSLVLEFEQALEVVQSLDPPGVGARDLQECLLLQLERGGDACPVEKRLIRDHMDDIMNNRVPRIVRETGLDIETVRNCLDMIASLHPKPGIVFGGVVHPYVIPDVTVEMVDGKYEVRIEESGMPRLRLSNAYRRMLQERGGDEETKEFIRKKIEGARWLMQAVEMRRTTLLRISTQIVQKQKGFLDHGVRHLQPLKMQDVAQDTGLHVSTVSRAITDKYMQTPQGIFEMRYFFTGGTTQDDGSQTTNESIKQKVMAMVKAEDKSDPISDDEIVARLKEQGVKLARRTVTKYRRALNIPPSRQRKRF